MFGLGLTELIVVLAIGLILFGNRLPDMARWLGRSVTELRRETSRLSDDLRDATGRAS